MIRAFIRDFKRLFSDKRGDDYTNPSTLATTGAKLAIGASLATGAAVTATEMNNQTDKATVKAQSNITAPLGVSGAADNKIKSVYEKN